MCKGDVSGRENKELYDKKMEQNMVYIEVEKRQSESFWKDTREMIGNTNIIEKTEKKWINMQRLEK